MNPQAEHMADASMVRTLRHQADAIWPQESALFTRHPPPPGGKILDVGCGTGEIALRLARTFPDAEVVGVDLVESHLDRARSAALSLGGRARFQAGNAFALDFEDASFDLTVCRHLLQAVPHPEKIVAEMTRVTRPGGRLHLLVEDYGMLFFHPTRFDASRFWLDGPKVFAERTGTDLHVGRAAFSILRRLGITDIAVDYVAVDTLRVPRETFAGILESWRDGYAQAVASSTGMGLADVVARFDDMISALRNPDGYGLWLVPIVTGAVPR
jgi:SAM-dependent methyltransferase